MKTILITGANGFVGSNLYDALSSDFHLIGLAIPDPKTPYGKSKLEAEEYIQQSTVNSQQSTVSSQQSAVNSQQSAVNSQQSAASRLPPVLSTPWPARVIFSICP